MKGLSTEEAKARLTKYGYNELPSSGPRTIWAIIADVIREPMFILLIICGVLYMLLGDYREGFILLSTILIIIYITFYQHRKTERALESLRSLSSPRALVLRDGVEVRIPGREVVPGDIMIVNEGDRIAADASVEETLNLSVDEALLTGESVPVFKAVNRDLADESGLVFSGTLVVQGKALTLVTATGLATRFGKIGQSLQTIKTEGSTNLQKEMKVLIRTLFIAGIFISTAVVVAFYYTRGEFIPSLLNGLAASMAILPEEFPVVLTIFLALGAWRLSKVNVLTRNPTAIETLGSATVLCSDKTGTITQNKMQVAALFRDKVWTGSDAFASHKEELRGLLYAAHLASQKDSVDPMEKAITVAYHELFGEDNNNLQLLKEYPLKREMMAMTRVLQIGSGARITVCKGAPETVFTLCRMDEERQISLRRAVQEKAEEGYRVLAVAEVINHQHELPESQSQFEFKFVGLLALEDPIRPEVPAAIRQCSEAGIRVVMITGDYPATAHSIGQKIGLPADGCIMTGKELGEMNDDQLKEVIEKISVFARVLPEQKLRIVQALKANHEVVAMTGDGVNDAPALKAADIGIAMGNKGTDVAREASSLVLLDDNFASIVAAIRSGRKIYDNLQKAMSYIMAIHIPIIGLTLLPAFYPALPLLLLPLHIVFMELIIDPVSSVAFESEQEELKLMQRPPRRYDERFFGAGKIMSSVFKGLLLLFMVAAVFYLSMLEGHSEGEVRAITFCALIIGNVFLILSTLSNTRSYLSVIAEKNIAVATILTGAVIILILIISFPYLQDIFRFRFPGYAHFLTSLGGAFILLSIFEFIKYFRNVLSKR